MRVTFLGTGDAGGVPRYGCDCQACGQARLVQHSRRQPCTALVESGNTRLLIDAGLVDLTERFPPGSLTAILLTHYHPDHVQGLFHLRWGLGAALPVYGPPDSEGCADLYKHPGILEFNRLSKFTTLTIGDLQVTPLPLIHSKVTFGYAIEASGGSRFAYLTDTMGLPPRSEEFLANWQPHGLALDCSYPPRENPRNHNDWTLAHDLVQRIRPRSACLTHISHNLDAWLLADGQQPAEGIVLARDGMVLDIDPLVTPEL